MLSLIDEFIDFVRSLYPDEANNIPLHRPYFNDLEKEYLNECIDSNFVSSVGKRVDEFENRIEDLTGAEKAVAAVNGTAALHIALMLTGTGPDTEVITQPLTFIATCNAIRYCGALPVFIDVDRETLGMSPESLESFLELYGIEQQGQVVNKKTERKISACVPMHTFGHPCRIDEIVHICNQYGIPVIEDAAEALGSYYKGEHLGTFGKLGIISFNGNKIITTGGGGMIVSDDIELMARAKHITTTAKVSHPYEYNHDELGYNYRLPNLNAALGCAQMDKLDKFLKIKRNIAKQYKSFFKDQPPHFIDEPENAESNFWLNGIILDSKVEKLKFLEETNRNHVMTRPVWGLMPDQNMYRMSQSFNLDNSQWLAERVVNIPSSVPNGEMND